MTEPGRSAGRPAMAGVGVLICALAIAAGGTDAFAELAFVRPCRDATLIEDPAGALANGAGPAIFSGRINSVSRSIRRALLAFDVAAAVPPGSTVTGARLWLNLSATSGGPATVGLHRLLQDWGEGPSASSGGGGAPAAPGDSTWIHRFFDDVFWTLPGGDFAPESRGEAVVDQPGLYVWGTTPGMVADVQSWLDQPDSAHGWILLGDETAPQTVKRFDSREAQEEANRPLLEIEFVPPCSPDPLGPGSWRRACEAVVGEALGDAGMSRGPFLVEPASAGEILACANRLLADLGVTGLDACRALLSPPPPTCRDRAAARLSVLVLNVCAGRLQTSCPVDAAEDGCSATSVGELLREISVLIGEGDCRRASGCAGSLD